MGHGHKSAKMWICGRDSTEEGCGKPESEKGLYSRSFSDVGDAETNAARPLMVIDVEPLI